MNKKIHIIGNVQGVFFRKSTQQKAIELGIMGWVKNEPDGSVTTEIEGELHAVSEMIKWLKHGPPQARVEDLWVEDGAMQGYKDFSILF